jgi:hypothetical protein
VTAVVTPLQPTKDGPPGSWEEVAADALRMRQIVELLVEGRSYHQIADELGIVYTTMLRIAPKVTTFINDETRVLAQIWQAVEYSRLESASEKLLPHILSDERADDDADPNQAEAAAKNAEPPDPKLIAAYRQLVSAKLAVLTLNRQKVQLPDDAGAADDQAGEKARVVGRFMELSHQIVYGIAEAGVGSGEAEPGDDDEDDYEDGLTARADNSGSIADAVVIDKTDFDDDSLDSKPGQWIDGRFYALAD